MPHAKTFLPHESDREQVAELVVGVMLENIAKQGRWGESWSRMAMGCPRGESMVVAMAMQVLRGRILRARKKAAKAKMHHAGEEDRSKLGCEGTHVGVLAPVSLVLRRVSFRLS